MIATPGNENDKDEKESISNEERLKEFEIPSLFKELLNITDSKKEKQQKLLKETIDKISNDEGWNKMILFEEYCICDPEIGLRQDFIHSIETGEQILNYPVLPYFDEKELKKSKLKNKYDITGYLSKLMVIANSLNDEFHETIKLLLIDDVKCKYMEGPIKLLERCIHKAEVEYSDKIWPNTACLVKLLFFCVCVCVFDLTLFCSAH